MKKCKFLATLLALILALSSIPVLTVTTLAEATTWDYDIPAATEIDADGINTYGELAYAIANGSENQTITLTGDIDLGGNTLNNADFGKLLNGMVIDGAGFTIQNFVINSSAGGGLFSTAAGAHVTIKNLKIGNTDAPITGTFGGVKSSVSGILIGNGGNGISDAADTNTGAAGGYSFDIENVHVYTQITASADQSNTIGGIVGSVKLTADSTIKNCSVSGSIYNTMNEANIFPYSGGLVGSVTTAKKADNTGYSLSISNCVNNAEVKSSRNAAGFVSLINDVNVVLKISDCVNNGNMTAVLGSGGFIYYNKAVTTITNCVNTGTIIMDSGSYAKSTLGCAGLIGAVLGGSATIDKSANIGHIQINNDAKAVLYAGGLVGFINAGKVAVTNSVNASDIVNMSESEGQNYASHVVGWVKSSGATLEKVEGCIYAGTLKGTDIITQDDAKDSAEAGLTDNIVYAATADSVDALNKLVKDNGWMCGEYFYLDNSGEAAVIKFDKAVPQLVGVQKTVVADGKFDIRFVAVIKEEDLAQYANVGFKVTPKVGETVGLTQNLNSTVVFSTLNAGTNTHTAAELGGEYIIALSVTGIPVTGTVEFTVAPYAINASSEETMCGSVWTLIYTDGVLTASDVVAE